MSVDSILTAHVADSIERINGRVDYDASADFAAFMLIRSPSLCEAATEYAHGRMAAGDLDRKTARAITLYRYSA